MTDPADRKVQVAEEVLREALEPVCRDLVQEWAIESQLWGTAPTNWPPCPEHPRTHPLRATTEEETPVWVCPASGEVVVRIGRL